MIWDLHTIIVIFIAFFFGILFVIYLFTNNPDGWPASERVTNYTYPTKTYKDIITQLNAEGHNFSDMQLCVRLVSFIYDKPLEQIRKDLWEEKQRLGS